MFHKNKYLICYKINEENDLFANINSMKLMRIAYDYILNGNNNFQDVIDIMDNKKIKFNRISAKEYVYGSNSKMLLSNEYNLKMRMAPYIGDLIRNAVIRYSSPLVHKSSLFKTGFNNYQGVLKFNDVIFRYIVRIGKAKNDNIFYDISLKKLDIEKGTEVRVPSTL